MPTLRNGQFRFSITTDEPAVPNVPTCPNPQRTAHVFDVEFGDAALSLFEDDQLSDQIVVAVSYFDPRHVRSPPWQLIVSP